MNTPTIGQILINNRDSPMKKLVFVQNALVISSNIVAKDKMKAGEVYKQLKAQDPSILDLTLNEALNPNARSKGKSIMTVIMHVMLILMATGVCSVNMYISYQKGQVMAWDDMILSFLCPILIVLHDRGLLRKENKDTLLALLGRSPAPTIGEAIATRYSRPKEIYVERDSSLDNSGKIEEGDPFGYK